MKNPDQLWLDICNRYKQQSKCRSRQVGCIIVKDDHQIMQGWNGAPYGSSCDDCKRPRCHCSTINSGIDLERAICAHSEANAIGYCARHGISTLGATLYCTSFPCSECAKLIIAAGIKEVVYFDTYPHLDISMKFFNNGGVKVRNFNNVC